MSQPHFVHIQLSGLWDADPKRWRVAISAACRAADVVTITEYTLGPLAENELPAGWAMIHFQGAGRNECAILYRTARFAKVGQAWCIPISKTPYALGSGKIRPRVHLLGVELADRNSPNKVNVEVLHTPSAIEGRNALIRGVRRTQALLECFAAIQAHRRAELAGEASLLAADWNLDLKKPWVRALLHARLRGWRSAWRKIPEGGSHGDRLIDGVRISRLLKVLGSSRLARRIRPFDHRMVVTVLAWR